MAGAERPRYPLFDVLRLYLALSVVFGHCYPDLFRPDHPLPLLPAVPTFVALSGFLIPSSLASSRSAGHFIWKRALRVLPLFLLSFVLVLVLHGYSALWPAFVMWLGMGFVEVESVNDPLWSLMLEEVLYAWTLVTRRLSSPILAWVCIGAAYAVIFEDRSHAPMRQLIPTIAFFLGNLLYHYRKHVERVHWVPLALGTVAALWLAVSVRFPMFWWPLSAVLAVATAFRLPQPRMHLPDWSYGVYVLHMPLLVLFRDRLHLQMHVVATFAATLALAALSWRYVESRALRLKNVRPFGNQPA